MISWRRCLPFVAASAIVLLPCFWHSRIQAGDLASHVYNAWLAIQVEKGAAQGLVIASQWTNVLFDLLLAGLAGMVGFGAAQRIAVALSVLVFFWGAFFLIARATGKRPWFITPFVAMFAYGWMFQMGLFNFYLSMGLSMWALALACPTEGRVHNIARLVGAIILLLAAAVAHVPPVLWAVSVGFYAWLIPRVPPAVRSAMPLAVLGAIVAVRYIVMARFAYDWSGWQAVAMTGIEQVTIFGTKYFIIAGALLVFWTMMLARLFFTRGPRSLTAGTYFQITLFIVASVFLIPSRIQLPQYRNVLGFLAERTSLMADIALCVLAVALPPKRLERAALAAIAALYFCFLYVDTGAINRFEDKMEQVVSTLPPGQRVVSCVRPLRSHVNALAHTLDRVAAGRCFSYANYEVSTGQFRLRALADSPVALSDYDDSYGVQIGSYVVKERDLPLYQLYLAGNSPDDLRVRQLKAGDLSGNTWWAAPPFL